MISEVLDNKPGLGKHEGLCSLFSLYADKRGFAQWMDGLELRRSRPVDSLVRLQLIVNSQLFEQPKDTLCSRFLEPRAISTD